MSETQHDHPSEAELHAFLDGELQGLRQAELAIHVQVCAGCSQRLERLQRLFALIASAPEVALERDLSGQILRDLRSTGRRLRYLAVLEAVAAAALLLLGIPLLSAAEWSTALARALQSWLGVIASDLSQLLAGVPAWIERLQYAIPSLTGPGARLGLPSIPLTQLWLVAGSAAALGLVGNGLLLRRTTFRREEKR